MNAQSHVDKPEIKPAALKIRESATYLGGLSTITVRRLIERGKLKRHPAFRHVVIPISELDRFLKEI